MPRAVAWGAASVLVAGLLPMPYDFYTVLRVVALVVFTLGARVLLRRGSSVQAAVFAVLAVLFNPFFPIQALRGIVWVILTRFLPVEAAGVYR